MVNIRKKNFLGIPVDDFKIDEIINYINYKQKERTLNIMSANITALRRFDNKYRDFSDKFDFLTADGRGLKFFSGILGSHLPWQLTCAQGNTLCRFRIQPDAF